jgi:hypothetical protein
MGKPRDGTRHSYQRCIVCGRFVSNLPMPVAGWTAVLFAALFLAIVEGVQAGAG